jgi:hypothetical protein
MRLAAEQRRAAPQRGRWFRQRAQADQQHTAGSARSALQVQQLISSAAEVTALERALDCAAESFVEGAELGGQVAAGGQQRTEERCVDVRCVAISKRESESHCVSVGGKESGKLGTVVATGQAQLTAR